MKKHNYTKCLLHLIWGTKNRKPLLERAARKQLSQYLYVYAEKKEIFMHINYVNADHTHALIDLPVQYTISDIFRLFKGSSSFWINQNQLTNSKFNWGRGYGAFSVSESSIEKVKNYIRNQEEHHRKKNDKKEFEEFISVYKIKR